MYIFSLLIGGYLFIKADKRIRNATLSIERLMRGNYEINKPLGDEGDGEILLFQLGQLAKRLNLAQDELTAEKESMKNMISEISHQFKTPLASLKTFHEILLDLQHEDDTNIVKDIQVKKEFQIDKDKEIDLYSYKEIEKEIDKEIDLYINDAEDKDNGNKENKKIEPVDYFDNANKSLRNTNTKLNVYSDEAIFREFLTKGLNQIEHMEWLINTLLKFSRLEAGVIKLELKNGNLVNTISSVISAFSEQLQGKNIKFKFNDVNEIMIRHDKDWIYEAVSNIIQNSILYSDPDSKIKITFVDTDSVIKLLIADTGRGIHKEELPKIFNRFYRGEEAKKLNKKGSGIGLSLSKLIIELHGGMLEYSSEYGLGTKATITLFKRTK